MKYRKLRIAWSALCGILCLLLIVLWVRSNRWVDGFSFANANVLVSQQGKLYFGPSRAYALANYLETVTSRPRSMRRYGPLLVISTWNGDSTATVTDSIAIVSTLLLTSLFAVLAPASWIRWRFSLRTMLIVTTLIAVVLGLIVWLR